MMHVRIDYPNATAEKLILDLVENEARTEQTNDFTPLSQADLFQAREEILNLHLSDETKTYIVELVMATRQAEKYSADFARYIEYGVSPRHSCLISMRPRFSLAKRPRLCLASRRTSGGTRCLPTPIVNQF